MAVVLLSLFQFKGSLGVQHLYLKPGNTLCSVSISSTIYDCTEKSDNGVCPHLLLLHRHCPLA